MDGWWGSVRTTHTQPPPTYDGNNTYASDLFITLRTNGNKNLGEYFK